MAEPYRDGTVTATNGSNTVTGALTAFLMHAKIGDVWIPDVDGLSYCITAVNDNTEFEIVPAYSGTTGSGKAYSIARVSTSWNSVSEISVSLAEILAAQSNITAGTGVPSDSSGADGDVYFRQDVAQYYTKGSGTWTLVTSLIGPQGPAGPSLQATSTSSNTVETGSKTFTIETERGFSANMRVRAAVDASNYIEGPVTSYSGTTLIFNATRAVGSGTSTSWTINVTGDVGPANSLAIGTVTTGTAGSSASASITGSAPSQTLNLTIPRGNPGLQGDPGSQGAAATVAVGTVTTLSTGSDATVANAGTTSAAVLNFGIPRGATGAAGAGITYIGDYNGGTTYSLNQEVTDDGSTWRYINNTPGSGNAPPTYPTTSNSYWQLSARRGVDGSGAVDSVNSQTGAVVLEGSDIEAGLTPVNYIALGASIDDHLDGLDTAIGLLKDYPFPSQIVATASTVDIGSYASAEIVLSGSTTVNSLGSAPNKIRFIRALASFTLAHNAVSVILPGGRNFQFLAGDMAICVSDGSGNYRVWPQRSAGIRERLTGNRTYYVRDDASNSGNNSGLVNTAGGAFLTVQQAIEAIYLLDISIYNVTIQVKDGTYTGASVVNGSWLGSGTVTVVGNVSNPQNVIIDPPSGTCFSAASGGVLTVSGMELRGSVSLLADVNGRINMGPGLRIGSSVYQIYITGGYIVCTNGYTIVGTGALYHLICGSGGGFLGTSLPLTFEGSQAWSGAFINASSAGSNITFFLNEFNYPTVTISIASPGVVTYANHGLTANQPFALATTGALPTGATAGTTYYVKTVLDDDTFTFSATPGGTVIATTGSQSGVHELTNTGARYSINGPAFVSLAGVDPSTLPGNAAGSTSLGGQIG